jgi:hypothetical protein
MDGICSACEGDEKCSQDFSKKIVKVETSWETLDIFEVKCKTTNWIHLAQNRVHWQTFMNTVMRIYVQ